MKPNLVVIMGSTAIRYVNGQRDQIAIIDYTNPLQIIYKHIEHFRKYGLEE